MERAIADSEEVMSSSLAMVERAGAMMVETMILLKPVAERTAIRHISTLVHQYLTA